MSRHHLTDTELIGLRYDTPRPAAADDHLATCDTCLARHLAVTELLDEVSESAALDADRAFPPDALARQQQRILARVAHEARTAKVISFPAAQPAVAVSYPRTGSRWVAAAVAAGVILGIVGEHVTQRITHATFDARPMWRASAQPPAAVVRRAVSTSGSDDEFFGQVELAFGSVGTATLRPLDVATPRAWDVRE